jgi:hypothetical protein
MRGVGSTAGFHAATRRRTAGHEGPAWRNLGLSDKPSLHGAMQEWRFKRLPARNWQDGVIQPMQPFNVIPPSTKQLCPTHIRLKGNGVQSVTLQWWANG